MDKQNANTSAPHTRISMEIRDVYDAIKKARIVTQPFFQRRYFWDHRMQTGLVNTILVGRVIPEVFVFVYREKGVEEVIDGQQRLETLRRFIDNEFVLYKWNCEVPELAGGSFKSLDDVYKNRLLTYPLTFCKIYSDEMDDDIKIQMFVDLNPLKSRGIRHQEIRNCIYAGKLNNFCKKLAEEKKFHIVYNTEEGSEDRRMEDVETVLSFLAIIENDFRWQSQQKALSRYMKKRAVEIEVMADEDRRALFDGWRKAFNHGLDAMIGIFGNNACQSRVQPKNTFFNRKYFLTMMAGLQDFKIDRLISKKLEIRKGIYQWIEGEGRQLWHGNTSRTTSANLQRMDVFKQYVANIVNAP